ncbi:winged helix-turn-helix transcriptional regulator [Sneathiella glossodoripedis]|uniref:winged helix-turn-helix transcriptional regulator n=1 Tax=Sneathiella glossodoripedis TaxID=418853 RepID=UPI000472B000|nr:helix-turn-helix domain-containing protein [Sneathiella glossodoripedis]
MAKQRSYKLLCPIARGLDRIGDRWTLLILRDLHAGPARFTDLQRGLTGIAANLLTERLTKLVEDELVQKTQGPHATTLYELTALGRSTRSLIFELAMFGAKFQPDSEIVDPGNLRTVAVTLGAAAEMVDTSALNVVASLIIDGEEMEVKAQGGTAAVSYWPANNPDVVLETSYKALMALSEGEMIEQDFLQDFCQLEIHSPGTEEDLFHLLSSILAVFKAN